MNSGFFSKIAWSGIKKNRQLYFPYIITCICMVFMFYIINALSVSPLLRHMSGGSNAAYILSFAKWVMGIFSLVFLFYTNSFLIRRRNKEFGLYNILGMNKKKIGKIISCESLIIAAISIVIGMVLGIALSKYAELLLFNIIHANIDYSFNIPLDAVNNTLLVFIIIFFLLYLFSLWQVYRSDPLKLLKSENTGEKPPKGNIIGFILGSVILGAAYFIAVSIKSPLAAMTWFFIAVIMVIVASYILLISGSVALCRILQKNKKYYYNKKHFISVSSMVYRMKRNGAGLASICILSTMVLVMLASTASLYIGADDSIKERYPREIYIEAQTNNIEYFDEDNIERFRGVSGKVTDKHGIEQKNILEYRSANIFGLLQDGYLNADSKALTNFDMNTYDDVTGIYIVPLEDYNRMMGTDETLGNNEALLYCYRTDYSEDTIKVAGADELKIKNVLTDFNINGAVTSVITPAVYIVVNDFNEYVRPLMTLADYNGEAMLSISWIYGFDINKGDKVQAAVYSKIKDRYRDISIEMGDAKITFQCDCVADNRDGFYQTFGGLFFIGIMLSVVFVFAAVLIIYYKQISEGYEDQSRFDIMKKVGMTKKDIRKTINSQTLTVFFIPLLLAGLHLAFAFPLVWKMLMMFNLHNKLLVMIVTICSFLIFGLFYAVVYKITSNAYYKIVNGGKK